MPAVGIRMFATIKSKDHPLTLQKDLQVLASSASYIDTLVECSDGQLQYSRLLVGLILPYLKTVSSFNFLPELTVLMPEYKRCEVEKMIADFLCLKTEDNLISESTNNDMDWTEAIDTIIDNLNPIAVKPVAIPEPVGTSAVLHSSLTREMAVIHSVGSSEHKVYTDANVGNNHFQPKQEERLFNREIREIGHHMPTHSPNIPHSPLLPSQMHLSRASISMPPVMTRPPTPSNCMIMQPMLPRPTTPNNFQKLNVPSRKQRFPPPMLNENLTRKTLPGSIQAGVLYKPRSPIHQQPASQPNMGGFKGRPPAPIQPKPPLGHVKSEPQQIATVPLLANQIRMETPNIIPMTQHINIAPQRIPEIHTSQQIPAPVIIPAVSQLQNLNTSITSLKKSTPTAPSENQSSTPPGDIKKMSNKTPNPSPGPSLVLKPKSTEKKSVILSPNNAKPLTKGRPSKKILKTSLIIKEDDSASNVVEMAEASKEKNTPKHKNGDRENKLSVFKKSFKGQKSPKGKEYDEREVLVSDDDIKIENIIKRKFICPVCHEPFKTSDLMGNHMKIHSDKHKCQICDLVCTKARELIEHMRIHSGVKLVKCEICDKDFTEKGLKLHTERFHKTELKMIEAIKQPKTPSKTFKSRARSHIVNYREDNLISFSSDDENGENDSSEGEDLEDDNEPVLPIVKSTKQKRNEFCQSCDKYFTKKGMKLHMIRYHKSERPAKKVSKERKNVALKKTLECATCPKKFSHMASLKVHEKTHDKRKAQQGDKPFKCIQCNNCFETASKLTKHITGQHMMS